PTCWRLSEPMRDTVPDTIALPLYVTLPVTVDLDEHPANPERAATVTAMAAPRAIRAIMCGASVWVIPNRGGPGRPPGRAPPAGPGHADPVRNCRPAESVEGDHLAAVDARHLDQRRGRRRVGEEPDRPVTQQPVPAARVQAPVVHRGARVVDRGLGLEVRRGR